MNEKLLKQALTYLADQAIPTNYDPCSVIRKRLETDPRSPKNQVASKLLVPRLRLAGLAALLILLVGIIFFVTPQGRAIAQEVIHLFTFAESDVLPLPTGQPTEPPPLTLTAAPTYVVELQEVTPAANAFGVQEYPTATPAVISEEADALKWDLTIEQAEQLAGFELRVPGSLPPGYRLDNVVFNSLRKEVIQFYEFHPYSAGEQFILHQQLSRPSDVIGQSATVEQMMIGDVSVEYVVGGWFGDAGDGTETWHSDSIFHTFRWQEGDFYFTLEILFDDSDTWSPAYWTKDGMLALAETIIDVRSKVPEQINLNNITSIDQAEKMAGFELLVPSVLPEGFIFSRAIYEPQTKRVLLFYQPQDESLTSSGVSLMIIETHRTDQSTGVSWEGYPQNALEEVMVSGSPATFARGIVADGVYESGPNLHLVWNTMNLSIAIIFSAPAEYPARLEKEEMLTIAESMQ